MKKIIIALVFLTSLACGVMTVPASVVNTPNALATQNQDIPTRPQESPSATETPYPAPTATPAQLRVYGTWNVRELPCVDCPVARYQVDGTVTFLGWAENGFIQIGVHEYICARAVLMNVECQ